MHLDPQGGRTIRKLLIAVVTGWLVSWLGVAALITLWIAWPHNSVPRVLLVVWAIMAAVSIAIPARRSPSRGGWLLLVLAAPFAPFGRAAMMVWPLLPKGLQVFLEGNYRARHRWARLQRKRAR
jgi:hypothetical protein